MVRTLARAALIAALAVAGLAAVGGPTVSADTHTEARKLLGRTR